MIVGAVLVVRDISGREETDRRIAECNEQLQAFVDAAPHDMRAPLRSVSNFSQLLFRRSGQVLDQDSRHYLEIIVTTIRRMDRLLDDLRPPLRRRAISGQRSRTRLRSRPPFGPPARISEGTSKAHNGGPN